MKRRSLILWPLTFPAIGTAAAPSPLRVDRILGPDDGADAGFARAEAPRRFEFPADHGPHPRYRSEWWYLTANLRDADGAEFGVQFTLFRQALRPEPVIEGPWDATQIYLGHLAVTDVAGRRHRYAERVARGHPRLAGVTANPFRAWIDGWSLRADGAGLEGLVLDAGHERFGVRLTMDPIKSIVLQGEAGLSRKGPDQASYYYSVPRLAAAGSLRLGGRQVEVTGHGWLDREWSTSVLSDDQIGWDWFALQLVSGEEVMMFRLRRRDGARDPHDHGVWVGEDGRHSHLAASAYTLTPRRYWRDRNGVKWPVAWDIEVQLPVGRRRWRVEAALDDQRMDTLLVYWEGMVRVFDEAGDRVGSGYLELTGYQ
jgi:predicted secreted hydrolase